MNFYNRSVSRQRLYLKKKKKKKIERKFHEFNRFTTLLTRSRFFYFQSHRGVSVYASNSFPARFLKLSRLFARARQLRERLSSRIQRTKADEQRTEVDRLVGSEAVNLERSHNSHQGKFHYFRILFLLIPSLSRRR